MKFRLSPGDNPRQLKFNSGVIKYQFLISKLHSGHGSKLMTSQMFITNADHLFKAQVSSA